MSFLDLLGFFALLFFILVSFAQRSTTLKDGIDEDEQAERLKEFLHGVKDDMQKLPLKKPLKNPKQIKHKVQEPAISRVKEEKFYLETHHDVKDAYAIQKKPRKSRAINLIKGLKSPKEMVLLHEIIGPPKALRHESIGHFPR